MHPITTSLSVSGIWQPKREVDAAVIATEPGYRAGLDGLPDCPASEASATSRRVAK